MKIIKYQNDIDGLRAVAVFAVVFFHLGFFEYGYLGVDIFFVISGYLISTKIISETNFDIKAFYKRRVKRILPLAFVISLLALLLGICFMLPDDLENLAQSVIASNVSANNILLYITTGDYWNTANDYKPLMHTWSLGVEEQFYFFYPLIFLLLKNNFHRILVTIILFTSSLLCFLFIENQEFIFFMIITRFWEIAYGGIIAFFFDSKTIDYKLKTIALLIIVILMFVLELISFPKLGLLAVVLFSGVLMIKSDKDSKLIYNNKFFNFFGKISFSIYLWHQLILAFYRYLFTEDFDLKFVIFYLIVVFLLSYLTYVFIENFFRSSKKIKFINTVLFLSVVFVLSSGLSTFIIKHKGILRDVPELDILKEDFNKINHHNEYNDRVRALNYSFNKNDKTKLKVLLFGDSYARDFGNILLESNYNSFIDLRYLHYDQSNDNLLSNTDIIFFCEESGSKKSLVDSVAKTYNKKHFIVGSKKFGNSMGKFYNNSNCDITTHYDTRVKEINKNLQIIFGNLYIDMMTPIIDNNKVKVFTPDCKFISQDTKHLTKRGARYYASLLDSKLFKIINNSKLHNE